MPQNLVLNNLIQFVIITEEKFSSKLKKNLSETKDIFTRTKLERQLNKHTAEFPIYLNELRTEFSEGQCFGFSVCHAFMQIVGNLEWWEAVLRLIADWKNERFEEKMTLINKNRTTRYQLFQRALNYLHPTQCSSDSDHSLLFSFSLANTYQYNLLKPIESKTIETHHPLEYLDNKGHIKEIKKNIMMPGYFTKKHIKKLVKPNLKKNILAIIHNDIHAVRIGKIGKKFIIYNPNYPHSTHYHHSRIACIPFLSFSRIRPIYKIYNSLDEMLTELVIIEDLSITIELASFNIDEEFDMRYYNQLSKTPLFLIQNGGLHQIAKFNPLLCATIVIKARSSVELEKKLAEELLRSHRDYSGFDYIALHAEKAMQELILLAKHPSGRNVHAALLIVLLKKTIHDNTGLHILANSCPKGLSKLLGLAETKEEDAIRQVLAKGLVLQNSMDSTPLHFMAYRSPKNLYRLMNILDLRPSLANALLLQNSKKFTVLHSMAHFSPDIFSKFLDLTRKKEGENIKQILAQALPIQTIEGWTCLHVICKYSPKTLPALLQLAEEKNGENLTQALANALPLQNMDGYTPLQLVYSPEFLSKLSDFAEKNEYENIREALARTLTLHTSKGWTNLHSIARYFPNIFLKLLNLAEKTKGSTIRQNIFKALSIQNLDGWTGLHMICRYSPDALFPLLNLAENNEMDLQQAFAKTLPLQNSHGWTALNFVVEFAPQVIPQLIQLLSQDERSIEQFHRAIHHSKNLNHSAITEFIIRKNLIIIEEKQQNKELEQIIIPKDIILLNQKSETIVVSAKQTVTTQYNYSRFFKPLPLICASVIVGAATAGLGGAIALPSTVYLAPKATNALSEHCRKRKR